MLSCRLHLHSWQYQTKVAVYSKNGNVVREREEIYQRVCVHCKRTERNVGKYGQWVRVANNIESDVK